MCRIMKYNCQETLGYIYHDTGVYPVYMKQVLISVA